MLRGTVTIAGVSVALPLMGTLAGCKGTVAADISEAMPLVTAVADRIIPQTDTPGAVAAGVPAYVALVAQDFFTDEQRGTFLEGLEAIAQTARDQGLASLETATPEQQDAVLQSLVDAPAGSAARGAWRNLHDLVVFGFYTSEEATQELAYEELPGRYNGCVPYEEVGRAWLDRGGNWQMSEGE